MWRKEGHRENDTFIIDISKSSQTGGSTEDTQMDTVWLENGG